jgi:hypothetical protein
MNKWDIISNYVKVRNIILKPTRFIGDLSGFFLTAENTEIPQKNQYN